MALYRWSDCVRSQAALGVGGVLLVAVSVASGLGLCALLDIAFNAATSQIVPFLALGLGVDAMFLLAQTYLEQSKKERIEADEEVGQKFLFISRRCFSGPVILFRKSH